MLHLESGIFTPLLLPPVNCSSTACQVMPIQSLDIVMSVSIFTVLFTGFPVPFTGFLSTLSSSENYNCYDTNYYQTSKNIQGNIHSSLLLLLVQNTVLRSTRLRFRNISTITPC